MSKELSEKLGNRVGVLVVLVMLGWGLWSTVAQAHETGVIHTEAGAMVVGVAIPEIDALTAALTEAAQQIDTKTTAAVTARTVAPTTNQELVSLAKKRNTLMRDLAAQSPADFLRTVIAETVRAKLPVAVQAEIETAVTVGGTVSVLHADDFTNPTNSRFIYRLQSGKNNSPLYVAGVAPGVTSGDVVQVSGYSLGGLVVARAETGVTVTSRVRPDSVGTQQVLVIPVTSTAIGSKKPLLPVQLQQLIFQGPFRDYYREQSFNRVGFTGTSTDWIVVPAGDYPRGVCDVGVVSVAHPAVTAYLRAKKINLAEYSRVVFIIPERTGGCGQIGKTGVTVGSQTFLLSQAWVSLPDASIGTYSYFENGVRRPTPYGSTTEEYAFTHCRLRARSVPTSTVACTWNGTEIFSTKKPDIWAPGLSSFSYILAHEFGHNLGVWHANALSCGDKNYTDNCTHVEYGNAFDVMGSGLVSTSYRFQGGHFNGYYKNYLGWIPGVNNLKVTQTGTYTLRPIETATGTQLVTITNPAAASRPLYVELRQAIGFDRPLRPAVAGLLINEVVNQNMARLLNANQLRTVSNLEPALMPGQTFRDDSRGIAISNLTISKGTASFLVTLSKPVCRLGLLPFAINAPQFRNATTTAGGQFDFTYNITDDDAAGCPDINLTPQLTVPGIPNVFTTYYPAQLTMYPGPQFYVSVVGTVPSTTKTGIYPYTLQVTDAVNNRVRTGSGLISIATSTVAVTSIPVTKKSPLTTASFDTPTLLQQLRKKIESLRQILLER